MANSSNNDARRQQAPRRRRRPGVPVLLTIVLLIMALLMGGLAGYAIALRFSPRIRSQVRELQEFRDRVTELENRLTLIGADDDEDLGQWLADDADVSALDELSGSGWDDDVEELWSDDSLLSNTLPEDTEPVVVAEFEGGQLLSSEVVPAYNDQLTTQIFAGHDAAEVAEETLNRVLEQLAGDKIIAARAAELGMTELSEDDLKQIQAEAERVYETRLSDYVAFVAGDGMSREDAAQRLAEDSGVTLESVVEDLKQSWWKQKFYDQIVRDVEVSDEEVQAHYDALLASQRDTFTGYPEEFEYAHQTGRTLVFVPEGYRAVRDVLIAFSPEDAEAVGKLAEQIEQGTAEEGAQARLDALYAPLEKTAQEVQEKLNGGTPFAELMDQYGCGAALKEEPLRSEGYYVSDRTFLNSTEFVEGCMMLEQPGQVSAPLRSPFGVHLVEYIGDVAPGEIPLEQVRDAIRAEALKEKQAAYYDQQRQALLEAAQVKYYPERLH